MYDTSLGGIEQLMMLASSFISRESGIVIQNYFNCEGGVVNCNCRESSARGICYTDICSYFKGNLKVDRIEYVDLLKKCFGKIKNHSLKDRLKFLTNSSTGELFLNHRRKERFYHVLHKQSIDINA